MSEGYSPQARGRSERVLSTLQGRLPKELKLAGIETVEAANRWMADTYIADHNKMFAIGPEQEDSAFVADGLGAAREILCVQEDRLAGLQAEYARWLEALPKATRDTVTGEALQAIADLDLEEILSIWPPRGFGRDQAGTSG